MTHEELIKHYSEKTYLGDSVYIHFDGYHFILETMNGFPNDPSNRIALEPPVFDKLIKHRKACYEDFEQLIKNEETKNA